MINRINLVLQAKNITARQFAEEIGIQPSGMSHILSGRNNPSLEFIKRVITRYPEISMDWLVNGTGEMMRSANRATTSPTPSTNPYTSAETNANDLFSQPEEEFEQENNNIANEPEQQEYTPTSMMPKEIPPAKDHHGRAIKRIILFYDDNTFESYEP